MDETAAGKPPELMVIEGRTWSIFNGSPPESSNFAALIH
jgi:hypothetical protein